jgi:acyl-CoA reductase-like NAD-dependent aldehyde dehydrogenase
MIGSRLATIQSINPATRQVIGSAPINGPGEVAHAIDNAWKAFDSWQVSDFSVRRRKIAKLKKVISQAKEEITELV